MRPRTDLLANRYELRAPIAGGGMGQVWRGQDTLLDRPVAVKVLRDQFAGNATFLTRFRAEAQHAALLTHPHIAAVFDYGEVPAGPDGSPLAYLVMELVEGESLADLLARVGRLDPARTVDILWQAADGLAAAHAAGVVHRDIKPANLLVTPQGVVKITDFGIARSAASVAVTGTGQVIGTAHYFSPEQATGGASTPASDVYALGTVGYECLAGRRPFEAENPVQIAVMHIRDAPPPLPAGIPAGVRALVERAMAKDPHARFPDGAALRDAAGRLAPGLPTSPTRRATTAVLPVAGPGTTPMAAATTAARARSRWAIPLLAGLGALLLAVAVLAVVLPDRSEPAPPGEAPTATTPAGIEVLAAAHIGRPVQEVQADLVGRGLRVELVAVETADVPAGQVTALDPVGTLAPGDLVRLSYAVSPVPVPAPVPPPVDPGDDGREDREEAEEDRKKAEEERKEAEEEAKEAEEKARKDAEEAMKEAEEERQDREEDREEGGD
ncbi:protein kinase domain-containing protein [Blastococcus saxobsidens]|uniref:non-specific serine/threonine protein kinase n=1 Tax=Blastococcus saxobsidens (strain DD2) TaxID=1146883 RepID=H6RJ15_BLASD|nr:protein kinase [Blastococcus saxobsidens]CCG04760.1 Serine/threonine protein kinase [Blastococcus saxobsidens DD2]